MIISELLKYRYRAWRYRHIVDPGEINYIRQNLWKGQVAVDIGSHKGGYLYWFRNSVHNSGKVFGFEPQPNLYRALSKIIKYSNYENVVLENCGVSALDGTSEFHIPVEKSSSPSASIGEIQTESITVTIDVVSLDTYFLTRNIFPNFIKIDVEGHESQVLKGGVELLQKARPKILMECETRHLGDQDIFDVFKILIDLNYQGYFFEGKQLHSLDKFDPKVHQGKERMARAKDYVNNFIFEPKS